MEAKLDLLLASMNRIEAKFDKLENKVTVLQDRVTAHDTALADLQAQLKKMKVGHNIMAQNSRASVIRIFNFPVAEAESSDGNKSLSAKIYDRVLKPILTVAKNKSELAALPQLQTCITECFRTRASNSSNAAPAVVICKLANTAFKTAIMRNK